MQQLGRYKGEFCRHKEFVYRIPIVPVINVFDNINEQSCMIVNYSEWCDYKFESNDNMFRVFCMPNNYTMAKLPKMIIEGHYTVLFAIEIEEIVKKAFEGKYREG